MKVRWLLAGPGRCGLQLARSMCLRELEVVGVLVASDRGAASVHRVLPGVPCHHRAAGLPPFDAVILALPDDTLETAAEDLARRVPSETGVALHTSGVHPASVLAPLAKQGWSIGSFHPLTSFPPAAEARVDLTGVLAAVEGDDAAVALATRLGQRLAMQVRRVSPESKPLYHAAAVLAANLTHVLIVAACDALVAAGFSRAEAAEALRPLVRQSLEGAFSSTGLENLTGPLARGDAATIRTHLAALPLHTANAYRAIARLALRGIARDDLGPTRRARLQEARRALTARRGRASLPDDAAP